MDQAQTLNVGIVGGTGYTGAELLRLLGTHPHCRVGAITSRQEAGRRVDELFPQMRGRLDLTFTEPTLDSLADCDCVFFATPHAAAMHFVPELLDAGKRVIDLSADFRLRDLDVWAEWYGQPHACPEWVEQAVYGLPELNRAALGSAALVACPGCYPTSIILGFAPLLEAGVVDTTRLIADAKTGVSGAGKSLKTPFLFGEMAESFKAYGVGGHRHLPEIRQALADLAKVEVGVTFMPHLVPMVRGIHSTLYAQLGTAEIDLQALYETRYAKEPFVDVMPAGSAPETRSVRGANDCRLAVHRPSSDTVVVLSVIDNLVKGASGQAIQCMNLMYGWPETRGLEVPALLP
ncbi:MAG: N-acetyl-gamma-glutamyl-phosphate reductase [Salinisphaeraceae bacterium]|nr:N-acetyl-gamma-glutamyl-phosphate reductase [Salinisphaeraceae bacterium]